MRQLKPFSKSDWIVFAVGMLIVVSVALWRSVIVVVQQ